MSSFCTNCGTPITPGSAFCTNCGTAVQSVEAQQPPPTNGTNQRLLIVGLIGAGAVALVTILLVTLLGGSGPEDAVKNTFKAFANGDCDRVIELTYFDENSTQTEDEARADCEDGKSISDFDVKILGSEDHDGDLPAGVSDAADVKVRVSATFLGRTYKETSTVTVYKVDGEWLVYEDDTDQSE